MTMPPGRGAGAGAGVGVGAGASVAVGRAIRVGKGAARPGAFPGGDAGVENLVERHLENPFLVLDLPPDAGAAEVERQGQMLLAMLAADLGEAARYATPLGERERSAELVRSAMAELRDPTRRLVHEWWARGLAVGR
jgi:hypothetical protein